MRKSRAKKRIILADPRFNDEMVTKFVNNMMLDGKKNLAFDIFYQAMDLIEKRTEEKRKKWIGKRFSKSSTK